MPGFGLTAVSIGGRESFRDGAHAHLFALGLAALERVSSRLARVADRVDLL